VPFADDGDRRLFRARGCARSDDGPALRAEETQLAAVQLEHRDRKRAGPQNALVSAPLAEQREFTAKGAGPLLGVD